jgi:hypothetical protein
MGRIARALRPGGIVAIWEPQRQDRAGRIRQIGGLLDLYFGCLSEAGSWSHAEIAGGFREAGLEARRTRSPRVGPDIELHVGRRRG